MSKLNASITVAEALNGLEGLCDRHAIENIKDLADDLAFQADVAVDVYDCIEVAEENGYVPSEEALQELNPNQRDLADGLRALIEGDRQIAAALLARAFSEWPDAVRTVEDILFARTVPDRRQLTLLPEAA